MEWKLFETLSIVLEGNLLWLIFLFVGQFQKYAPILMVELYIYWKPFFPMKIIKKKIFMPVWALGNFLTHLSEIGDL